MKMPGKLKVIARDAEPFNDRIDAGDQLAEALVYLKGPQTVVLGIPRGGLVVAAQVARRLGLPLDIVLSRKLGAPSQPELAIGSITENGEVFLDRDMAYRAGADEHYVHQETEKQLQELRRRREAYRGICPKIDLKNKDVVLIDDGIATGSTVQAAFWSIRREKPHKLVGAFPVGPQDSLRRLCASADEIVCLKVPPNLDGIGRFYLDFGQVPEEEVLELLKKCAGKA